MAGEWVYIRLGDVCTKIGSGATPRGGSGVYLDSGEVSLIRSQNVYNDGFRHDGLVFLTEQHANGLSNVELQERDVLLNITGDSVARACQVDPKVLPARVNQHVAIIRPDPKHLSPLYLRYFLVSPLMQSHMMSLAGAGATRNALTKGMIEGFRVFAPADIREQQGIACILGALDDKIELNRRRNETLEGMAQALFQSWFIDFDPVRAKASGSNPRGIKPELAELFPDTFVDSPLGAIPTGWQVGTIKEFAARIQYGLTTSATQEPGGPQFLRITDIRGGTVDWNNVPYCDATDVDREKYRIEDGDIFVARTGASTGENVYLVDPPSSVFASYLVRFQFKEKGYSRIVAEFMRSPAYFEFVKSSIGGSAQPNANAQTLAGASLVFPHERTADRFYTLVRPFDLQRSTQDKESRTLAALRDTLLPKLISGELRVPDAERIIGRAL